MGEATSTIRSVPMTAATALNRQKAATSVPYPIRPPESWEKCRALALMRATAVVTQARATTTPSTTLPAGPSWASVIQRMSSVRGRGESSAPVAEAPR